MVYNYIDSFLKKDVYPFHMPGHKRNRRFLPAELLDMEITEFPGADSLLAPEGIIMELENRVARAFGSSRSLIMTNGSTGCILAAILSVGKAGAPVITARNCHKSVYSGMVLTGMKPVYIFPELTDIDIAGGISPEAVRAALTENPGAAAVVLTSPTFEGFVSNIGEIADVAHAFGVPLIVDEAHGANLNFSSELPPSAVTQGADLVIHSLHKQLPMMSQTAVLHVNGNIIDPGIAKKSVGIIQSTSPSYVFLAQIDYALDLLLTDEAIIRDYIDNLADFRRRYKSDKIRLVQNEYNGRYGITATDQSKLVFRINGGAMTGKQLEFTLINEYKIQIEMSGLRHVVAMTSPADTKEGYERLLSAMRDISAKLPDGNGAQRTPVPPRPTTKLSPRDAFYSATRRVPLMDACGLVSAGFVIPYPPGTPVIAPGELITREVLDYVKLCRDCGMTVTGSETVDTVM